MPHRAGTQPDHEGPPSDHKLSYCGGYWSRVCLKFATTMNHRERIPTVSLPTEVRRSVFLCLYERIPKPTHSPPLKFYV